MSPYWFAKVQATSATFYLDHAACVSQMTSPPRNQPITHTRSVAPLVVNDSVSHHELGEAHVFTAQKTLKQNGSQAVRSLLAHALEALNINDTLSNNQHPYRLTQSNRLVSFSHSTQCVAVALAKTNLSGLGVDVEDNAVSMAVARRFFAAKEVVWLESLVPEKQAQICKWLWMAKEAHIKASQGTLIQGLKQDFSQLSATITQRIFNQSPSGHEPFHLGSSTVYLHPNWACVVSNS